MSTETAHTVMAARSTGTHDGSVCALVLTGVAITQARPAVTRIYSRRQALWSGGGPPGFPVPWVPFASLTVEIIASCPECSSRPCPATTRSVTAVPVAVGYYK